MASTTVGSNAIVLEVLNQHNYEDWSSRVKTYLVANDLWDIVRKKPPPDKDSRKDAEALHAIKISCGTEMFSFIRQSESETAHEAWTVLAEKFKDKNNGPFKKKEKDTELRTAAKTGDVDTVRKLLSPLTNNEELKNKVDSRTVLDDVIAASSAEEGLHIEIVGAIVEKNEEIVRAMVEKNEEIKNEEIVKVGSWPWNYIPVVRACSRNKWKMAHCLLSHTPIEALLSETTVTKKKEKKKDGIHGAQLICMCIWGAFENADTGGPTGLDIAWQVLQKELDHKKVLQDELDQKKVLQEELDQKVLQEELDLKKLPKLALADNGHGEQPMHVLAGTRRAFRSGTPLTLWQKLIYKCVGKRIQPIEFGIPERRIPVSESEDKPSQRNQFFFELCNVMKDFFKRASTGASNLLGINHVYKMKLNHFRFQEFLRFMVKVMKDLENFTPAERRVARNSLFKAIEQGHVEFIKHMCEANPTVEHFFDDKKRSIFQYAIECRQEKIYNLIYELKEEQRSDITHKVAQFKTNMLHSAANLSSVTHFKHIQGASLQMQRELQWFKEVESMLPGKMREYKNTSKLTARELFTENHKELKNEAEISMKAIASSCMTVGALIVTMTFAIAFTVPGGSNSDSGLPMFMHKKLFKIFILSDTISLISSAASVITFLGLLTSTYAEDDFLWHLPTKLMIGLSTLFISIVAMMIAFICSLTIMLDGDTNMIITVIVFATLPVVAFAFFLFPLLYEICRSTYGPSIFCKKSGIKH